ncbi:MAG: TadA family conjugal transfer-associated ATPase [Candidatus Nanopelagicales bacterium]
MSGLAGAALVDRVRSRLVADDADPTPSRVAAVLRDEGVVLGDDTVLDLVATLRDELAGAGPLEPLLRDPEVTDVLVNGPGETWVDRGHGLDRVAVRFRDEAAVRRLAQRLAAYAGRRLDDASPYVDARLADGTRLHAVLPPVAARGTLISLRVPRRRAFTLDGLVAAGSLDAEGARWLAAMVAARVAFLVSGGTGTGKTTVLSTLLGLVDPGERLLLVEDSGELLPHHPHVVRLEARPPNLEGSGAVSLRDLVRQALRMRPDRVVVGEVRGAEVVDLLAALNTGHEGGCGTVHANSAGDVPARLEALALSAGLPRTALHALAGAGLDAVIHLARGRDGARRVDALHVLRRDERGYVHTVPALTFGPEGPVAGEGLAGLAERLGHHAPGHPPGRPPSIRSGASPGGARGGRP